MKKLILSLIVLLVVVTVVSACQNKANYNDDKINNSTTADHSKEGDSRKNENYKINNQSNNDKPNLKDVEKWKKFNEKDFNFTFYYPNDWGYKLRQFDAGLAKADFSSSWKSKIMIAENSNSPVGMEIYDLLKVEVREIKSADTDLVISYYKINKDISGLNEDFKAVMIQWKKGKNFNQKKLQKVPKVLTSADNNSGRIFLTKYSPNYDNYYNLIIDKIASSFKFK